MYVPGQFRQEDVGELKRLMRAHGFATLVTTGPDGAPFATHLPLLLEEDPDDADTLWLRSHMARANPQWKHFANGAENPGPSSMDRTRWFIRTGTHPRPTCRPGITRSSMPTGR